MAGGGVKGGTSYGGTDELGMHAIKDPVSFHDFHAINKMNKFVKPKKDIVAASKPNMGKPHAIVVIIHACVMRYLSAKTPRGAALFFQWVGGRGPLGPINNV
mgnify:CR=1 FL=1